jgi:catechol-2,3-dioxygenase
MAQKKKSFSVYFEDAEGNGRNLSIQAPNKTEARRMAKEWMREEGENLRGATFVVED